MTSAAVSTARKTFDQLIDEAETRTLESSLSLESMCDNINFELYRNATTKTEQKTKLKLENNLRNR